MKKKYFHTTIVLLVLFASNLHAQDTVSWGYYRYMFPPLRCKFHLFNRDNYGLIPPRVSATYFYMSAYAAKPFVGAYIPEEPVTVYGATITMHHVTDMRAVLWVKRGDTMYFIDSCHWSSQIAQKQHHFLYNNICESAPLRGDTIIDSAPSLYEFYFTQPHIMSDTFYIGLQTLGTDGRPHPNEGSTREILGLAYLSDYFAGCGVVAHGLGWMYIEPFSSLDPFSPSKPYTLTGIPGALDSTGVYAVVFPIIELPCDSTIAPCPQVENFGLEVLSPNQVSFSWDTVGEQTDFQISFGLYDMPADSNLWRMASSNPETYTGIWDEKTYYAAYIRAKCHKHCEQIDTSFWGPWSDPIFFHTGNFMPDTSHHADTTASIDALVPDYNQFTLSPNPAHHSVSIALPQMPFDDMKRQLALVDASGKEIFRKEFAGDRYTIDLSAYPAGVYYVTIFTPLGSATQKLIVE